MKRPYIGQRFLHFEGGWYEVFKIDHRIWYKPIFSDGESHPRQANPGTVCSCLPEDWPVVSGQIPPPPTQEALPL